MKVNKKFQFIHRMTTFTYAVLKYTLTRIVTARAWQTPPKNVM